MGFSRQEQQSGLPCHPLGDLPNSGIEPMSLSLLHWQVGSLPLAPPAPGQVKTCPEKEAFHQASRQVKKKKTVKMSEDRNFEEFQTSSALFRDHLTTCSQSYCNCEVLVFKTATELGMKYRIRTL